MTGRPFRFGVVAAQAGSGKEWADKAHSIESMGLRDHADAGWIEVDARPLTGTDGCRDGDQMLRVGTYVIASDFRNVVGDELMERLALVVERLSGR